MSDATYSDAMMKCPLLSWQDTCNGSPLEILESIPGMIRAAAHECGKSHREPCQNGQCFVGAVSEFGEYEFFNEMDVTAPETDFPERVKHSDMKVWLFCFCPKCGASLDRKSFADIFGKELKDCD